MNTPLLVLLIQVAIIMLALIFAQNQRFGLAQRIQPQTQDNSEAYIQALAGVLEKSGRSQFVVDVVGQATLLQLQQALGLGRRRLDIPALKVAWTEQTGRSADELEQILSNKQSTELSRRQLLEWIQQVEKIHLSSQRPT